MIPIISKLKKINIRHKAYLSLNIEITIKKIYVLFNIL